LDTVAVILRRGQEVLLLQRPPSGRWANLWEFPNLTRQDGEAIEKGALRVVRQLTGMTARLGPKLAEIKHGVTRYRITMICHEAEAGKGSPRLTEHPCHVWVRPGQLESYPLSSPHRKLAQMLTSPAR
ncbi:MAG: NUDIX domain-containing protein, partial [Gemmataceae bacterium]